jgi:hypothetical protein
MKTTRKNASARKNQDQAAWFSRNDAKLAHAKVLVVSLRKGGDITKGDLVAHYAALRVAIQPLPGTDTHDNFRLAVVHAGHAE